MSPGRAGFAEARPGAVTERQSVACKPSIHTPKAQQALDAALWALLLGQVLAPYMSDCGSASGEEGGWQAAAARASPLGIPKEAPESLRGGVGAQMTSLTLDSILLEGAALGMETTGS